MGIRHTVKEANMSVMTISINGLNSLVKGKLTDLFI